MQSPKNLLSAATGRRGLVAGLVAFLILGAADRFGVLQVAENWAQDRLRVQLAEPLDPRIELVYLDDVSLRTAEEQFGETFPWKRAIYGFAVDALREAGAKVIVFDFLFTSKSSWGDHDDAAFAKAMKRHGKVVLGMQFTAIDQPEGRASFMAQKPLHRLEEGGRLWPVVRGVDFPREPLWSAAAGVGDTYFEQDNDGMSRRARMAATLEHDGSYFYPSLGIATARAFGVETPLGERAVRGILFRKKPGSVTPLFDLAASKVRMDEGEAPLVDLSRFKDKIVLIGSSAPGLKDLRPSPVGKAEPGVLIQATVVDNLIRGEHLGIWRPGRYIRMGLLLLICLSVSMLSFRLPKFLLPMPALLVGVGATALSIWAYQAHHLLLPVAHWATAAVLGFALGATEYFVNEKSERRKIQSAFGQFLSPAVLASLKAKGDQLEMGGETRTLTVFFSDLQGFTNFSEKLSPHDLVVILNEYLDEMGDVVVGRYDATVDKYIGDAIMAFWNAPVDQADHAWRGCAAAWACQLRLAQIQDALKAKGLDAGEEGLVMRIGLNTGPAVAGLMGSQRKLNYTVMGDTVNTASRLEGANKPYGSRIMISQATKDAAGDKVLTRPLDFIKVKGKADATSVYEIIGLAGEPGALYDASYVQAWTAALLAYKAGDFQKAKAGFAACQAQQPKDKACGLFIERCDHYIEEPPKDWDGVYTMKTK